MDLKAIAMIELNSIAKGVEAADEMLKSADVALVMAQPICAGKYMALVTGDVDSVERAAEVGKEMAGEFLVDDFVIPNVHASVFPALTATTRIHEIDSLAVIETFSVASSTSSLLVTSTLSKYACPPDWVISAANSFPAPSTRSHITTLAPSSAKRSTALRPIPCAPPVITTTFYSSSPISTSNYSRTGQSGQSKTE